jgi:pyrimidine operon attenuation protein/uracil phosphoribosyltransferase
VKKLKARLLDEADFQRSLTRLAHEIIERHNDLSSVAIVGIHTRGEYIGKRLVELLKQHKNVEVPFGTVDVTFYRDDFRTHLPSPEVASTNINLALDDLNIILVDDVLYTGRTIRAALNSIMDYGRPSTIELAVMVDRGHRELPIQADFVGRTHPTSINEHIHVHVTEVDDEDAVLLLEYEL